MRKAFLAVLMAIFLVSSVQVFAEYNKDMTVKAMRENFSALTKAKTAAGTSDFYAAAEGLMVIARNAVALSAMDPPKGSKADWEAAQKLLARAAYKGIGACGMMDKAGLDAAISEVVAAQMKGHGSFKG
jgi:hypothetical protein